MVHLIVALDVPGAAGEVGFMEDAVVAFLKGLLLRKAENEASMFIFTEKHVSLR